MPPVKPVPTNLQNRVHLDGDFGFDPEVGPNAGRLFMHRENFAYIYLVRILIRSIASLIYKSTAYNQLDLDKITNDDSTRAFNILYILAHISNRESLIWKKVHSQIGHIRNIALQHINTVSIFVTKGRLFCGKNAEEGKEGDNDDDEASLSCIQAVHVVANLHILYNGCVNLQSSFLVNVGIDPIANHAHQDSIYVKLLDVAQSLFRILKIKFYKIRLDDREWLRDVITQTSTNDFSVLQNPISSNPFNKENPHVFKLRVDVDAFLGWAAFYLDIDIGIITMDLVHWMQTILNENENFCWYQYTVKAIRHNRRTCPNALCL
ncbi:hypothetical protein H4219_005545 [Mycoemilia scoparia]|uniref:Uncharacterized protein n=1 Tax=Mycoemilia scoparia TaxID=417184 RepID=A0A9W8DKW3_9FUNG|nr:hypothetical protein H4219_005545 [Mycoemilia scoparia]